jgi:cobalt-zinc-cadmium efflux system protein
MRGTDHQRAHGDRRHDHALDQAHDNAPEHEHGHDHVRVDTANERRMLWALLLIGGFMVVEAGGGLLSGSLALLADAGHMLTDTAALALGWFAFRAGRKPADALKSYGHHRFQVLVALLNGAALIAIAGWIVVEALRRLSAPTEVAGGLMLVVALVGLVANVIAFIVLHGGDGENLNVQSAMLHVVGDLLGFVGTIAAAYIIMTTGWMLIDPILSVLVALLVLRGAWRIVDKSWHVLMEGTPTGLDIERLRRELADAVPEIQDVHHVHAWSLTPERPLVTLHALVEENADQDDVLRRMNHVLASHFQIEHATIQLERVHCADPEHGEAGCR